MIATEKSRGVFCLAGASTAARRSAWRARRSARSAPMLAAAVLMLAVLAIVMSGPTAFANAPVSRSSFQKEPASSRGQREKVSQQAWQDNLEQPLEEWRIEEDTLDLGLPLGSPSSLISRLEGASLDSAVEIVKKWLNFLRGEGRQAAAYMADASGYPLEQALELFTELSEELNVGASRIITMKLPEGVPDSLGPVGLVAAVRAGEDLDLSLFGGDEWETIHLDFLATNPLIEWASEMLTERVRERLREAAGAPELITKLLAAAAKAGRAVTVAPLNEQLKEKYRKLGFREDALLDPTLMFWIPSEQPVALPGLR